MAYSLLSIFSSQVTMDKWVNICALVSSVRWAAYKEVVTPSFFTDLLITFLLMSRTSLSSYSWHYYSLIAHIYVAPESLHKRFSVNHFSVDEFTASLEMINISVSLCFRCMVFLRLWMPTSTPAQTDTIWPQNLISATQRLPPGWTEQNPSGGSWKRPVLYLKSSLLFSYIIVP